MDTHKNTQILPLFKQDPMIRYVLRFLLGSGILGLLLFFPSFILAQPDSEDREITIFREKQDEMLALLKKQKPRLAELDEMVADNAAKIKRLEDFLKYPKNAQLYRDTAQKQLVTIRKRNDEIYRELEKQHFNWFKYSRHLMAVYTRYGEFKAFKKQDDELSRFLLSYREYIFQVEGIIVKLQDIYSTCDYLLTAKLN